jgi:tetratricopeptide (TPR) repeat protein
MRRTLTARRTMIAATIAIALLLLIAGAESRAASDTNQRFASHFCELGTNSLAHNDLPSAQKMFESALRVNPDFPAAHIGLGHIAMRRGDYASALSHYERAKADWERSPDGATAEEDLGDGRAAGPGRGADGPDATPAPSDRNLSDSWFPRRDREPQTGSAGPDRSDRPPPPKSVPASLYFMIGNAQFKLHRYEDARQSWETCSTINPRAAAAFHNLAIVYFVMGRYVESEANLGRAERLGLTNETLRRILDKLMATRRDERTTPA